MSSVQFSSVAQSCPTLCDPMNRSTPGLPVHHQLPEFTQTHVHQVSDATQPSHPLSFPSPPVPNPSQHQSLFQWVNSSQEVAKVLEFQLQHHSLQGNPRADLLQNGLVGSPCSPRDSKSLLQHHSSKASILWRSAFFTVQLSHPSGQWRLPAISSSVIPFSSCPQSLPASESFPMSKLFAEVAKVLEIQL